MSANLAGVSGIMDSMANFKTSQQVGDRASAILQDLTTISVEGTAADGNVKVTYNGQQKPLSVEIDDAYFQSLSRKSGANDLSIAVTKAMQDAHEKSSSKLDEKMKTFYSDLGFKET